MKFSKVFFKSEDPSLGSLTYSLAVLGRDFSLLSKFELNPRQTKLFPKLFSSQTNTLQGS